MKKIILLVDGMTCSACSNGLEKYLNKQDGIESANVNLVMSTASILYDEKKLNIENLEQFVKKAGFKSLGEFKEIKFDTISKIDKIKFIIFTVLAVILLYVVLSNMFTLPILNIVNSKTNPKGYAIFLGIFAIIFIIYGFDILKNGYKNLIHKTPNMDTLVSIGVLSSFIYSIYNLILIFRGNVGASYSLYFEACVMVIYFVKLGRYIDRISKDKTKEATKKLVTITPKSAVIKVDDGEKEVTIDEIIKGDIVICKPGEKIAVDGKIIKGKAHLDEAFITGESMPTIRKPGDNVIAGSINYDGYIEYKAERIGKDSTISEIVRLVSEASSTKAPIGKLADKISGYFVPFVMIIAILTFFVYLALGYGFSESLVTFVTILVVACPCSLGLATPLALVVSEGKCANSGILVKKGEILENVAKVNSVAFDKTGTLTYGKLKISKIKNYTVTSNEELLQLVGSIEVNSTHPIAKVFAEFLEENKIRKLDVEEFKNVPGLGVVAKVKDKRIILGNDKILEKYNIENKHKDDEQKLTKQGNSILYVVQNDKIIALIGVKDIVKKNSKDVVGKLNNMNIETVMLTGDNRGTAEIIARSIGIKKIVSGLLPKDKVSSIKKLQEENKFVMMCGDGINDSPSLMSADVGVSINSGTDIAKDSSDVILTGNEIDGVLNLINISKKTMRIIKQNLFWAFFYNALMIPIAMGLFKSFGININPMFASLAMVISSITVILNTLRLR